MTLKAAEINRHAEAIITSARIRNKAVILCEGDVDSVRASTLSPATYRKLEQKPDSNFYKACLPKSVRKQNAPQFFNCGNRADVIKIFAKLHELHQNAPEPIHLNIDKLFAIVDLDIQKSTIENYKFPDTEAIFKDLYCRLKINHVKKSEHIIFVTGLIHKEAYFLLPELQHLFDHYKNPVFYSNNRLDLHQLYHEILAESQHDQDLSNHLGVIQGRLSFSSLDCCTVANLQSSLHSKLQEGHPTTAEMLFLFRKAKPYWNKVHTASSISIAPERLREQLSLEIAKFYSEQDHSKCHLTAILNSICERAN